MASGSSHPARQQSSSNTGTADVLIVGAGIIGLSLALELHTRGLRLLVLERDTALSHASTAAAGMLAPQDPHNPPALFPLSELSARLYPAFLDRLHQLSGIAVPFHTDTTLQYRSGNSPQQLAENSLDPRQLAAALLASVRNTCIELREHCSFLPGEAPSAQTIVIAAGAWTSQLASCMVAPRKGQMLRVQLPPALRNLREVHRSDDVYIVPRTLGPQAGTALIGATIEDAGFDTSTHPRDLLLLRSLAARLLPDLADEAAAPMLEAWAGLRPSTPDRLPILGQTAPGQPILATGHYRNGILLAPATAVVLADLIQGKPAPLDLSPFSPTRFSLS